MVNVEYAAPLQKNQHGFHRPQLVGEMMKHRIKRNQIKRARLKRELLDRRVYDVNLPASI
jgi:hypothetical protein